MPYDSTDYGERPEQPVTAWTTYAELSPRQRALYGDYVLAKDRFRRQVRGSLERAARADAALKQAGGDKARALAILLGGAA